MRVLLALVNLEASDPHLPVIRAIAFERCVAGDAPEPIQVAREFFGQIRGEGAATSQEKESNDEERFLGPSQAIGVRATGWADCR